MPYVTVKDLIRQESQKAGIPPALALAVADQESGFNPTQVNQESGAIGTFQLLPDTAKTLGVDPHDPVQNIRGGVKYLRQLLDEHNGDVGAVLKTYGGVVNDTEYVPAVLAKLPKYAKETGVAPAPQQAALTAPAPAGTTTVAPPKGASPSLADRFKEAVPVVPGLNLKQAEDLATGFAKKAGARITEAGAYLRKKIPALDVGPSVTFSTEPTNTTQQIGAALEPVAEFMAPAGAIAKTVKGAKAALAAGRGVSALLTGGEAAAQGAAAYGVSKSQGASDIGAAVNAGLSAIGPAVSAALPAISQNIAKRAETQLAMRLSKGLEKESRGPAVNYALKTGDVSPDVTESVQIVRQAARDILDAPLRLSWGKWLTTLGKESAQKGQTLGQAVAGPLGQEPLGQQPILDALEQLRDSAVRHLAQIPSNDYAQVTYNEPLAKQIDALHDTLKKYGKTITVKNLTDLKQTWDDVVYNLSTVGKVGISPEVLVSNAQKQAASAGANAIRGIFDSEAPTIADLNEAFSHGKRVQDLVKKLYQAQPGMGKLGQWVTASAASGGGLAVGSVIGHPYIGLGFGHGAGLILARAMQSPLFHTLTPMMKDRLAQAVASGNMGTVAAIVRPMIQADAVVPATK